jgi:hypothetical protein
MGRASTPEPEPCPYPEPPIPEQALKHPYMASFYTGKEPKCPAVLTVPIDDDHK